MGDAVRDGDVHVGRSRRRRSMQRIRRRNRARTAMPVEVVAATRDYHELTSGRSPSLRDRRARSRAAAWAACSRRAIGGSAARSRSRSCCRRTATRRARFEREARITARLQHPSIVHVYEAGVWPGGEPFYAMKLVRGPLARRGDRRDDDARRAARAAAARDRGRRRARVRAQRGVIHRDLKPANVLVGEFGETVVIDWGLAKDLGAASDPKESLQLRLRATAEETVSGSVIGTPAYMPPEQARGEAVDERADVYALGAMLYHVLAGAPPYIGAIGRRGARAGEGAGRRCRCSEREPGAPPELRRDRRQGDGARSAMIATSRPRELAEDLQRFQTGQLVGAHRYTLARSSSRRWLRRHRVAVVDRGRRARRADRDRRVFSVRRIVDEKRTREPSARRACAAHRSCSRSAAAPSCSPGHAGAALAYLVGAAEDGATDGARGFLIADAMRPFQAERVRDRATAATSRVAVSPDGRHRRRRRRARSWSCRAPTAAPPCSSSPGVARPRVR